MRYLKILLCVALGFSMCFKSTLYANEVSKTPWVIDEHQVLSPLVLAGITNVLAESARKRNVHVRVIVLRFASHEMANRDAKRKVIEWENKDLSLKLNKTAYFIIHAARGESDIILGENLQNNTSFQENAHRIKRGIIQPILATGDIEKAAIEGAVALITVLEELPTIKPPSNTALVVRWLQHYHILALLKMLSVCFLLGGGYLVLKRYLRRYDWEEVTHEDTHQSLEEKMLLQSFAYREKLKEQDAHIQ